MKLVALKWLHELAEYRALEILFNFRSFANFIHSTQATQRHLGFGAFRPFRASHAMYASTKTFPKFIV